MLKALGLVLLDVVVASQTTFIIRGTQGVIWDVTMRSTGLYTLAVFPSKNASVVLFGGVGRIVSTVAPEMMEVVDEEKGVPDWDAVIVTSIVEVAKFVVLRMAISPEAYNREWSELEGPPAGVVAEGQAGVDTLDSLGE